jgi:hypothetical protein
MFVWEQHASQQPWQMSRCHGTPVLLVFEGEIASVRATFEVFGVGRLSGSSGSSSSSARTDRLMQASSSHGVTGGGAHGWRICNRLCTLGGLVWAILLEVHGSGRRGTLRYATRTYTDTDRGS